MQGPDDTAGDAVRVAAGLATVRRRIASAARSSGRDPGDVRLVAVSKFQPVAAIAAAVRAGHHDFGESRAQELRAKLGAVPSSVRWHFVGRLQRNKVAQVVGSVVLIHSVDRARLVDAIATQAARRGMSQDVLVQVNVLGEQRKGGCAVEDVPPLLAQAAALPGITVRGLMAIPPLDASPAAVFARVAALRATLAERFPQLTELSLGMSADLEEGIRHGATIVRIGTAVFGPRPDDDR